MGGVLPKVDLSKGKLLDVELSTAKPVVIDPYAKWLQRLVEQDPRRARSADRLPSPENMRPDIAYCRTEDYLPSGYKWRCGAQKTFPGALVGQITPRMPKFTGQFNTAAPVHSRLILHELPANELGQGPSWSHAQIIHLDLCEALDSPQYAWESQCPNCESSEVVPQLVELQAESNRLVSLGKRSLFDPSYCRDCHVHREGVAIDGSMGFIDPKVKGGYVVPVGSIVWFEIDPERDFGAERGLPTRRWVFFGDLDLRNVREAKYLWSALCAECFERHWRKVMAPAPRPLVVPG